MNTHSRSKIALALLLSIALGATGCSAQWISVALDDMPVLLQMALNIGTVVTTLRNGKQLSPADAALIQNISTEAAKDLTLLEALYKEYKATSSADTIRKIQNAIADINRNLPALLEAAHISDPNLSSRIAAGVDLILSTVNSFAALIPQPAAPLHAQVMRQKAPVPHVQDLKQRWNVEVCGFPGDAVLDSSLAGCSVH